MLSSVVRKKILARLRTLSDSLEQTQLSYGAWGRNYYGPASTERDREATESSIDQFVVTGHHLEWIAEAPLECRPNRASIESAARFLCKFTDECSAMTIRGTYGPFTHAARAVLMLSLASKTPASVGCSGGDENPLRRLQSARGASASMLDRRRGP
jgi:hypothetical protein